MTRLTATLVAMTTAACLSAPDETQDTQGLASNWPAHVISAAYVGADGHSTGDIDGDGDQDIAVAWEQSSRVTLHRNPGPAGGPWPTVASYAHGAAEDVLLADIDGDGYLDLASAGQDKRIRIAFGAAGGFVGAPVTITVATGLQYWMQLAFDPALGLVAGGRVAYPATVSLFTSATPRVAASWTRTTLGPAGWTMGLELLDYDGNGSLDVLTSDRQWSSTCAACPRDYNHQGVGYLSQGPPGTWTRTMILPASGGAMARFFDRPTGHLLSGTVHATTNASALSLDGVAIPYPTGTAPYHAARLADIDLDGTTDIVVTTAAGTATDLGVVVMLGPSFTTTVDIAGLTGAKFDEVQAIDMDGDGDGDILTTEQNDNVGLVWYENPTL